MELVPEIINDVVVLNLQSTDGRSFDDKAGSDVGVAVHNYLVSSEIGYVIIDLQDEKEIPTAFMVELLQLHKRLRIPFLFVGVMPKAQMILNDYNFSIHDYPIFSGPEEAVAYMKVQHPLLSSASTALVKEGDVLQVSRPRHLYKNGFESEEDSSAAEEDEE
ncbi:hypothetical protein N9D31_01090 [Oligoflexaceae bacterium]|nr:hypothetical protein [Oligoflexaceae bacterium]